MDMGSQTRMLLRLVFLVCVLAFMLYLAADGSDGEAAVFYLDDGSVYDTVEIDEDEGIAYPEDPEREGYAFSGWRYTSSPEGVRFYPVWEAESYVLSLDMCDGSPLFTMSYVFGEDVRLPCLPGRAGYTLAGWREDVPLTMPASNVTLHAVWQLNSHRVAFYDGDRILSEAVMDYGSAIEVPSVGGRTGYTFDGWDSTVPSTVPDEDSVFRTVWHIDRHTISFDSRGGSDVGDIVADYGSSLEPPGDPVRTGYRFTGWTPSIPESMPAEDLRLTAGWEIVSYGFTIDTSDGSAPVTRYLHCGDDIGAVDDPVRTGYTFGGWDADIPGKMPDHDLRVTAVWSADMHTISFETSGGSPVPAVTLPFGTAVTAPDDPVRTGYSFVSWSGTVPSAMPAEDMVLTASWSVNSYTLSFDAAGGSYIAPQTSAYGSAVVPPDDPVRTGYIFTGWLPAVPSEVPAEDTEYVAQWSARMYTVSFDTCGGSDVGGITGVYGSAVHTPAPPLRDGYTFVSWDSEVPSSMPAEDTRLRALWRANTYSISFDTAGGTPMEDVEAEFGSEMVIGRPSREGYTFAGWAPEVPSAVPSHDVVLTALWTRNSYRLSFDTRGGTPVDPMMILFGDPVPATGTTVREGYSFECWDTEVPETMPAEDLVLSAVWSVNRYRIAFDTCGGTPVDPVYADFGSEVRIDAVPYREGYSFERWGPSVPALMPAEDLVLSAEWSVNTYHAVFSDGDHAEDVPVEYGSAVSAPVLGRTGYSMRWDAPVPDSMPSHDISLHAVWTADRHSVVFMDRSREIASGTSDYGTEVVYPELHRTGYVLGWDIEIDSVPDRDMEIHAVWTPGVYRAAFDLGGSIVEEAVEYGGRIPVPTPEGREGMVFSGWSPAVPAVMPGEDRVFTAVWSPDASCVPSVTDAYAVDGRGSVLGVRAEDGGTLFDGVGARSVYALECDRDMDGKIHVSIPVDVPEGYVPVVWVICGGDVVEQESAVYSDGCLSFDTESAYWAYGFAEKEEDAVFPSDILVCVSAFLLSAFAVSVSAVIARHR